MSHPATYALRSDERALLDAVWTRHGLPEDATVAQIARCGAELGRKPLTRIASAR